VTGGNLEGQALNGRYQIQTLIGQGGMAAVYKAYDPNLHRSVAIKVIHPHLSNNVDFTRRFEEEATAVAHLRHPNIVQVYDFDHDGNLYYMVMEFIAGETLQSRLKRLNETRRRVPVQDALKFSAEICDAADYAHQRGMIHRDIKPANVMLDVFGKAILMDFGIARIVGGMEHTATGAVLGTAMYMSPEQIQGLHADARADIYSLGVTLYEMLSGRPPYEADSAMTLMMMHLNDPVPNVRDLQPDAPPEVVRLIDKAMAKTREGRYQSAAEMAAALRAVQGELVNAPQASIAVAAAVAVPAIDATLIETAAPIAVGATAIETAGRAAAVSRSAQQTGSVGRQYQSIPAGNQTYIEQPAQTAPAVSKPAAAFPASPDQSSFPVNKGRSKTLPFLLIGLVVVLAVGGFFAYQKFLKPGSVGLSAPPIATEANQVAVLIPTETSPPTNVAPPTQPADPPAVDATALPAEAVLAAPSPTSTEQQAPTQEPTPTTAPTETATPTPAPVVIGGADKIAFISGGNVWTANLDGSELTQLTSDGSTKTYLRWLPDGQGLSYIMGKCIHTLTLQAEDQPLTCFNNAKYVESFEISPDGTQVEVGVDNQLYLLPYDLTALQQAHTHADLAGMAGCTDLAPYQRNFGRSVRWSENGNKWAALVLGVLKDGRRGDLIQVFDVDRCIPNPLVQIQFPEPHFVYKGYQTNPTIENYAWDGESLFVLNDNKRNDGFGDLHVFNIENFQSLIALNPIRNVCCYRDAQWSPDGQFLVFAFQDYLQGSQSTTQLYMIPYGEIGSGSAFKPLPLPEITDPREKPQPVLRPAAAP
jgi:eukaryotic-like serine/threonine-protein kinase